MCESGQTNTWNFVLWCVMFVVDMETAKCRCDIYYISECGTEMTVLVTGAISLIAHSV